MLTDKKNYRWSHSSDTPGEHLSPDSTKDIDFSTRIIGDCSEMRALFRALPKVAASDAIVLISGESGTGKEIVARAIHEYSPRADGPFFAVNCAALAPGLIQSELFGHERGSFTGAHRRKIGRFEAASGGTILLDEIGDLPMDAQVNLLRFLETRKIERVGGFNSVEVDVRVIAATHVDLVQAVARERFREDLYHRLDVLSLSLPPLRDRGDDIQVLADRFFADFAAERRDQLGGFSADARLAMRQWQWPGNVRELKNRVQKAVVMCESGPISRQDLGLERRSHGRILSTLDEARETAVREAILTALDYTGHNVTEAADKLGVCRMTLYRLMRKHEIANTTEPHGQEIS